MAKAKVTFELWDEQGVTSTRWEQQGVSGEGGAFVLLGRAFEVAQRDSSTPFAQALMAFLKGASIQKADIVEALQRVEE